MFVQEKQRIIIFIYLVLKIIRNISLWQFSTIIMRSHDSPYAPAERIAINLPIRFIKIY